MKHVWEYLKEFSEALQKQLEEDEKRWGNTWLQRSPEGQEERTIAKFNDYFDQYREAGTPIPWLKITGNALICWIRDVHPELFSKEENK
jgi:hypothetical protein